MEELINTRYDTLTGALGGLWRTIQVDVLQPVGTMLIPYVEKGITVIDSLVDHWNELDPATQKTIVKFAAIAAGDRSGTVGSRKGINWNWRNDNKFRKSQRSNYEAYKWCWWI